MNHCGKSKVYTRVKRKSIRLQTSACSICMCKFCESDNKDYAKPLACGHKFHKSCIDEWLSTSSRCPLCRSHHTKIDYKSNDPDVIELLNARSKFREKYPPVGGFGWLANVYKNWDIEDSFREEFEILNLVEWIEDS